MSHAERGESFQIQDFWGTEQTALRADHIFGGNLNSEFGGEAGIRTLGKVLKPYNKLATCRFRPLSHLSKLLPIVSEK